MSPTATRLGTYDILSNELRLTLANPGVLTARIGDRGQRVSHGTAVVPTVPRGSMRSKGWVLKSGYTSSLLVLFAAISLSAQAPRRVTIDDLMALRTINDVKISPSGDRVAYTVSTPSVERNAHETALFVIPATGGTPKRLAETQRIYTPALPAPRLRWRPDGQTLSILVAGASGPQVLTVDPDTNAGHRGHVGAVRCHRV